MIFESAYNTTNWDAVQESPYEVGLEAAMMHMYENECNYNAIMKAAGIAELAYFKENGGDLFVQEASAGTGLIDRFIAFFKKVMEKIKQMCKKFIMQITSLCGDDKKWVKKYRSQILSNFKAFEFEGYTFPMKELNFSHYDEFKEMDVGKAAADPEFKNTGKELGSDYKESYVNKLRANAVGKSGEMDSNEFVDALKEVLQGEKDTFNVTIAYVTNALNEIDSASKDIKDVQKEESKHEASCKRYISKLEKVRNIISKNIGGTKENPEDKDVTKTKQIRINNITVAIDIAKEASQINTQAYGAWIGALKLRRKQNKAVCIKALNSASNKRLNSVGESAEYDIFANVSII